VVAICGALVVAVAAGGGWFELKRPRSKKEVRCQLGALFFGPGGDATG